METLPADNDVVLAAASNSSQSKADPERGDPSSSTVRRRNVNEGDAVEAKEEEEEVPGTTPALDRRSLLNSRLPTVPFARGLRSRLGSGALGVLEYLWEINGNFREASGALGDLGTFIPLFISLVNVTGLDPTLGLFFNGFANVVTGLSFPIPMPVQPMKSIAAQAIVGALTLNQMLLAGLVTGIIVFVLGVSGLIRVVNAWIPMSVVRGIQLGVGLSLGVKGLKMVKDGTGGWIGTQGSGGWDPDCYLVAAIAFVAVIAVEGPAGGGGGGGGGGAQVKMKAERKRERKGKGKEGTKEAEEQNGASESGNPRLPLAIGSDRGGEQMEEEMEEEEEVGRMESGRSDSHEEEEEEGDEEEKEEKEKDGSCSCRDASSGQRCGCFGSFLVSGLVPTALLLFVVGLGLGLGARAAGGGGGW